MITQTELDALRVKLLPSGAQRVIKVLDSHRDHVEIITIVMDKVPLLIIGRHGMIARLPVDGVLQKVSESKNIVTLLDLFFKQDQMLYLFVNIPHIQVPAHIKEMLAHIEVQYNDKNMLRAAIDDALDRKDRAAFMAYTAELQQMLDAGSIHISP